MSITRRPASGRVLAALSDTMRFLIYVVSTMPNSTRRASSPCPGSGTLAPTMTLSRRRVLAGIPTPLALAAAGRHAGAVVVPESTWRAEGMRPFISLAPPGAVLGSRRPVGRRRRGMEHRLEHLDR